MDRRNFHTHTALCKHASGCVADYCQAAAAQGVTVLGFSDHTPHPDGRWLSVRMAMDALPGYVNDIRAAQEAFPGIRVIAGMECEHVPEHLGFYRDELLGLHRLDYLIGAAHWYPDAGEWKPIHGAAMDAAELHAYTDYVVKTIASGLYAFIAHPDVFGISYRGAGEEFRACSRAIVQASVDSGVPLEINAYGLRKKMIQDGACWRFMYPLLPFWEIAAEYNTPVLVSSDAHRPDDVWGNTDECLAIAKHFALRVVNAEFLAVKAAVAAV